MELMQLEMFVAVVEERSVLKAAERVFRTQPAVSVAIRKLEDTVGIPLFDRPNRRCQKLTSAGELFYQYACQILGLRNEALLVVRQDIGSQGGTLQVGVTGEKTLQWVSLLTTTFKERYPKMRVEVSSDSFEALLRELSARRVDVALLCGRSKCEVESRDFLVTRVRGVEGQSWCWVVRQRFGRSLLAHAFERELIESLRPTRGLRHQKKVAAPPPMGARNKNL